MKKVMTARRYRIKTCGILFLLLGACVIYLVWPVTTLQVRSGIGSGVLRLAWSLPPESEVAVGFVHSIYGVEQEERYVVRGGKFRLASVYFGSLDALNYYDPLETYPRREVEEGYEVSVDIPVIQPVSFAVAHSTPMWLKIDDGPRIPLDRFAGHDDRFSLHLARQPRIAAGFVEVTHG